MTVFERLLESEDGLLHRLTDPDVDGQDPEQEYNQNTGIEEEIQTGNQY